METSIISVQEEKRKLRKKIKDIYKTLDRQEITQKSQKVLENIKSLEIWEKANIIFAFLPLGDEVDTTSIIEEALTKGKKAAVPRIAGSDIVFHYIASLSKDLLLKHDYGMNEPLPDAEYVDIDNLDNSRILILIPGMAFDQQCRRLGRGKSFYDRYLSVYGKNCIKAGIAFSFQITENLPCEDHDVQLDFVITDENIFKRHKA